MSLVEHDQVEAGEGSRLRRGGTCGVHTVCTPCIIHGGAISRVAAPSGYICVTYMHMCMYMCLQLGSQLEELAVHLVAHAGQPTAGCPLRRAASSARRASASVTAAQTCRRRRGAGRGGVGRRGAE